MTEIEHLTRLRESLIEEHEALLDTCFDDVDVINSAEHIVKGNVLFGFTVHPFGCAFDRRQVRVDVVIHGNNNYYIIKVVKHEDLVDDKVPEEMKEQLIKESIASYQRQLFHAQQALIRIAP